MTGAVRSRRPAQVPLAALLAGTLCVLLGGCVAVPSGGPVEQVAPRGSDEELLPVVSPSGPADGATPAAIVGGYLTAMEAFPVTTEVAREFLTARAAERWAPGLRTVVYETATTTPAGLELTEQTQQAERSTVELRIRELATLTRRGTFLPAAADGPGAARTLKLRRTDEGWRISDPPRAQLVSAGFFEEYFRPFDLYFLDPTGESLVADPVWLPQGDQLSTRLVQGLLAGPTPWLRRQAATTVLAEAGVEVSVPVRSDGVADVQLSSPVANLSGEQLEELSAQLAWTLRQVPGTTGVQLSADGGVLDVPGVDAVQDIDGWGQYDPSGPTSRAQLYGVRRGAIVTVGTDSVSAVAGWWGSGDAAVGEISVQSNLDRIAATDPDRLRLLVGDYVAEDRAAISVWYGSDGGSLVDPQWDLNGKLWVVDRRPGRDRIVVSAGAAARAVPAAGLGRSGIRGLAVAPDGARVAVLVDDWSGRVWGAGAELPDGPHLVVARVVRGPDGRAVRRIEGAYAVPVAEAGLRDLDAPVWAAPSLVGVLARAGGTPSQPYRVSLDGSEVSGGPLSSEPLLPDVGAVDLAAAGVLDAQTVVGDASGRLWAIDSRAEWSLLTDGVRDPRYPD